MIRFTKYGFTRITLLISGLLLISGCSSIASLYEEEPVKQAVMKDYRAKTAQELAQELEQTVSEQSEYIESIKPALDRLIVLESDLQYILKNLNNVPTLDEDMASLLMDDNILSSSEMNVLQFNDPVEEPLANNNFNNTKKSPIGSGVAVAAASPIEDKFKNERRDVIVADMSIDDKFSNAQANNSSQIAPANKTGLSAANNCQQVPFANSSDFALHLASFKNKQNAIEKSNQFKNQHETFLCGKKILVKEVVVNNQKYFSLRLGPYQKREKALESCTVLQQSDGYCSVTQYEGTDI